MSVSYVPATYPVISPTMNVKNVPEMIVWLEKVFDGKERMRMPGPGGTILHAEVGIGTGVIMLSEAVRDPVANVYACIYVPDCDATIARAIELGAKSKMAAQDTFWGDRSGAVIDPFGNHWHVATHVEDVTPEQMAERMKAMSPG